MYINNRVCYCLFILAYKGWNDPPKVSFDSYQQSTRKKPQLTKRHTIAQIGTQQVRYGGSLYTIQEAR